MRRTTTEREEKERNAGTDLDLDRVRDVRVDGSAVERRTEGLGARRSVEGAWEAAWLLRAVTCIDLTTLAGDDTPGRVRRLCAEARRPVPEDVLDGLGMAGAELTVAAVCVYHEMVEAAVRALRGTDVPVAAVSTGFPAGLSPFPQRLREIRASIEAGASEIDVVITRGHVLRGEWRAVYEEVRAFREACGPVRMKTILGTGELGSLRDVYRAGLVAMMAGSDFIKTSTGKERVNATLPAGLVMARAIRHYRERTGHVVGLKPAGGIRTAKEALLWLVLVKEELGERWTRPDLFRFGASSLLAEVVRRLEHHVALRRPGRPPAA